MADTDKYTEESITWLKAWAPNLFSFRLTRPAAFRFIPGQFARLGVRKLSASPAKVAPAERIAWRAYSVVSADYEEHLEFYSIVVPGGEFTSELARLRVGDTVLVDKTNYGFFTTDRFEQGRDLWMLSTGTGLAPYLSILRDPQVWAQYENLILVHCVRYPNELAYADTVAAFRTHPLFGEHGDRLRYVRAVTRAKLDGALHARIPSAIADGSLERAAGMSLDHERARIMICGNPEMVDDTRKLLKQMGYTTSRRGAPGHMAVENYW